MPEMDPGKQMFGSVMGGTKRAIGLAGPTGAFGATLKGGASGAMVGGSFGAMFGGVHGAAVGAIGGAAVGAVFGKIAGTGNKLKGVFQSLADTSQSLVEQFKEFSPLISRMAGQWEKLREELARAWAKTIAPTLKQISDLGQHWTRFRAGFRQRMFRIFEPFMKVGIGILTKIERWFTSWMDKIAGWIEAAADAAKKFLGWIPGLKDWIDKLTKVPAAKFPQLQSNQQWYGRDLSRSKRGIAGDIDRDTFTQVWNPYAPERKALVEALEHKEKRVAEQQRKYSDPQLGPLDENVIPWGLKNTNIDVWEFWRTTKIGWKPIKSIWQNYPTTPEGEEAFQKDVKQIKGANEQDTINQINYNREKRATIMVAREETKKVEKARNRLKAFDTELRKHGMWTGEFPYRSKQEHIDRVQRDYAEGDFQNTGLDQDFEEGLSPIAKELKRRYRKYLQQQEAIPDMGQPRELEDDYEPDISEQFDPRFARSRGIGKWSPKPRAGSREERSRKKRKRAFKRRDIKENIGRQKRIRALEGQLEELPELGIDDSPEEADKRERIENRIRQLKGETEQVNQIGSFHPDERQWERIREITEGKNIQRGSGAEDSDEDTDTKEPGEPRPVQAPHADDSWLKGPSESIRGQDSGLTVNINLTDIDRFEELLAQAKVEIWKELNGRSAEHLYQEFINVGEGTYA